MVRPTVTAANNELGAPLHELSRSPAAAAIGRLARHNGLFLSHFEHRLTLDFPDDWIPAGRPDLGHRPTWNHGVLAESKYLSFRHDRIVGSFHPGHRAKWTAHELCHGLIGYAWSPTFTLFEHAIAARIAEALPVALYYFFDEAGLRRCDRHRLGGPLHTEFCRACEQAAHYGSEATPRDEEWIISGMQWLENELQAAETSLETGRIIPHRFGALELGSDALAYAAAHAPRLHSQAFSMYVERFAPNLYGRVTSLAALLDRTRALAHAIISETNFTAWASTDRHTWVAQDIGFRLFTIWSETCDGADEALLEVIDNLANAPQDISSCISEYRDLALDYELPSAEEVFAVGYDLGQLGSWLPQLHAGLKSALPFTMDNLPDSLSIVSSFATQDERSRRPLAERFTEFLATDHTPYADVARYETALVTAQAPSEEAITLAPTCSPAPDTTIALAEHVQVLNFTSDIPALVDSYYEDTGVQPTEQPTCVCVFRTVYQEIAVLPVTGSTRDVILQLRNAPLKASEIPRGVLNALLSHSLILPDRYDGTPGKLNLRNE